MLKYCSSQPVSKKFDYVACHFILDLPVINAQTVIKSKIQLRATQRYVPTAVNYKFRIPVTYATYKETLAVTVPPKACARCNKFCDFIFGQQRQ